MILRKGKITQDLVNPASAGENLAQHIIRAFLSRLCLVDRRGFSQERMTYFPEDSKVVYRSKDGKEEKIFDALEWLVPPAAGVRYYGHYSNVSRGKRKKQDQDGLIPSILEPVEDPDISGDNFKKALGSNGPVYPALVN
jgi:hypothetical protein